MNNHEIARQACFLAKASSSWASDFLEFPEHINDPVCPDSLEIYLEEMRSRLYIIEQMNADPDTRAGKE